MAESPDILIQGYLDRVRQATAALPPHMRNEILQGITEHLQAGLDGRVGTAVEVRNLLDELGAPEQIAAAALDQLPAVAEPSRAPSGMPAVPLLLSVVAVSLIWIVWPVGVLCLWLSDTWTTRQKWLGTLVVPGGIWLAVWTTWLGVALPMRMSCSGGTVGGHVTPYTCSPPQWVGTLISAALLVVLVAPIAVAAYLGVVLIRRGIRRTAPA